MAKFIFVDEEKCLACKQCMVECALAHTHAANLVEALVSGEALEPRVHVEPVGHFGMPIQCNHCEDAPCINVCPTSAIFRSEEGGPVLLDRDRCIGCKSCILVCPFGVIDLSRSGKAVVKCDLCCERTAVGEEPACVVGCPTGALEFREMDDWLRARRREAVRRLAEASETPDGSAPS